MGMKKIMEKMVGDSIKDVQIYFEELNKEIKNLDNKIDLLDNKIKLICDKLNIDDETQD